uniref:Uncharacterized protein n=1 Tax=Phaeomonas parva TaxID=124430 RepID=A0A7S1XV89_9STRA|mmetsp:Transcript_40367/g.126291  ORF Transcript_40367/g.126291 Transcript_40367/m.126291 type:complete len:105 (+) Transcript_40367:73-387(+)
MKYTAFALVAFLACASAFVPSVPKTTAKIGTQALTMKMDVPKAAAAALPALLASAPVFASDAIANMPTESVALEVRTARHAVSLSHRHHDAIALDAYPLHDSEH